MPDQTTSRIILRRPRTNPSERGTWGEQHRWLGDRIARFLKVFKSRCEDCTESENENTPYTIRKRFWSKLLKRASEETDLHTNISPSRYSWIGTGAGVSGLQYVYSVKQTTSQIELYIDRGKGQQEFNRQTFEKLFATKVAIEQAFGHSLSWEPLDKKRACRIAFQIEGGYRTPLEAWPELHGKLIETMIHFEAALRDFVLGISQRK